MATRIMISLTKPLPWDWKCQGKSYRVNLAFDNVLRWYELLDREDKDDSEKGVIGWHMFVNADEVGPVDRLRALEWINQYISQQSYRDSSDDETTSENGQEITAVVNSGTPEEYFSYVQDAPAIWSSIRAFYGVDLEDELGKLHWYKFRAMLDGLPSSSYFMRIVGIRQRSREGLDGKELANLVELQNYYVLDKYRNAKHSSDAADFFAAWAASAAK